MDSRGWRRTRCGLTSRGEGVEGDRGSGEASEGSDRTVMLPREEPHQASQSKEHQKGSLEPGAQHFESSRAMRPLLSRQGNQPSPIQPDHQGAQRAIWEQFRRQQSNWVGKRENVKNSGGTVLAQDS